MARFTLTIHFDDPLAESEGPLMAQLAASTCIHALKHGTQIEVEDAELTDHHEALRPVDGHEYDDLLPCEMDT